METILRTIAKINIGIANGPVNNKNPAIRNTPPINVNIVLIFDIFILFSFNTINLLQHKILLDLVLPDFLHIL